MGRGGDPGAIVWDEMASVPAGLLVVPAAGRSAAVLLAAFLALAWIAGGILLDLAAPLPVRGDTELFLALTLSATATAVFKLMGVKANWTLRV